MAVSESGDIHLSDSELEAWGIGGIVGILLYVIISLILAVFVYKETLKVWGIQKTASTGVRFGVAFACIFFFPVAVLALIGKAIVNASESKKE